MKKQFSMAWNSSKQKRKQRKYRFNAPLHIKHNFVSANLSKELRKKYSKRSIPLHKGDTVKIMRGSFKKKKGKISRVSLFKLKVYIEGMQTTKRDGTKVEVPFEPSNLQIIELNTDDKERMKIFDRKKQGNAETKAKENIKAKETKKQEGKKQEGKTK